MQLSALAALLLVTTAARADDGTWTLEHLTAGAAAGAVCLDGSPCVTTARAYAARSTPA